MKNLFLIVLLLVVSTSCEDFEGWNVDTKNPAEVPADFLVTSAEYTLFLRLTSISVNYNIYKYYSQNVASTTYQDEPNYDLRTRDIGGTMFTYLYRDILNDLADAKQIVTDNNDLPADKANKLGQIELLEVFTWHILVDTFGDVPYTEALKAADGTYLPKYDDDQAIYTDLFRRLDQALVTLQAGGTGFADADLIYNGDSDAWIKFGNSLKLKMAVRVADADQGLAIAKAGEAYSAGVFGSDEDNFEYPFEASPPNTNPLWTSLVQSGRSDFIVANTFVDLIVPLNDPRTPIFLDDNITPYEGGIYGVNSPFANYTHIGPYFQESDLPGLLMSYSEVMFLVAEAAAKGILSGADAEAYYNEGVTSSIKFYGGSDADAAAYLAQPTVAYGTATYAERIGVQKYLALYMINGFESWSSWKLLDYPKMNIAGGSLLPVPRRYIYPNDEPNINGDNYDAASAAIGGDNLDSRVFWDINGKGNDNGNTPD
ncbi:SusD/RagB family nutrient-binding outer membrane lipoprotein [Lutimonas sp.]|uniref:SusD/RagB family nutrient-binding outer membrane lipoprotein n=1 Tax=Lutimonas sp. TaxID=1872403 RepID=UPI003D9AC0E1